MKYIFLFVSLMSFCSCHFSIEKRKYQNGFYFNYHRINSENESSFVNTPVPKNNLNSDYIQEQEFYPEEEPIIIQFQYTLIPEIFIPEISQNSNIKSLDEPVIVSKSHELIQTKINSVTSTKIHYERSKRMRIFLSVICVLTGLALGFGVFILAVALAFSGISVAPMLILIIGLYLDSFLIVYFIMRINSKKHPSETNLKRKQILISLGLALLILGGFFLLLRFI